MIKIINHGDMRYRFVCTNCNCEFSSNGDEIEREKQPNGKMWIVCPECDYKIRLEEEWLKSYEERRKIRK